MNKFFLSSMATMAGLIAICVGVGCSDDATQTTTADTTEPADGGKTPPPKTTPPPESPQNGSDSGVAEPATTCMDTKPFDATTVPYHPPAVKAGACTTADIKAFNDYLGNNPQVSVEDLQATLTKQSKRCSECVFGEADAEKWAPIVIDTTSATLNGGGCVSVVSGKDACGKAYQQWNTCLNEVCAACTDQSESAQCKNDAQKAEGPCGTASKALLGACGKNVNDYITKCFGNGNAVGTVIEQLCGASSKDGGS
jgi:hypothetical protein